LVIAPGVGLTLAYVGDWRALIGTGYGVMVLTKIALMVSALVLGALNYRLVPRWTTGAAARPGGAPARLAADRVRPFVEAEVGIGLTILFAAASLTSLPPAVDVVADRATPAEVLAHLGPRRPRRRCPRGA